MTPSKHRFFSAATTLLTLLCISLSVQAKTIERSFETVSGNTLHVRTDAGSINIDTHNKDQILVNVSIDGEDENFEVEFDEHSEGLKISGKRDSSWGWNNRLRVRFDITVPKQYELDLDTSGGKIEISDITGNIEVRTSGGAIEVGSVIGDVELDTSGGSIKTAAIEGEINAHTSGGSVEVVFAKQPTKNARLHTSGGSIRASFPSNIAIDIDASTSGGRVHSDFTVDGKVKKQSIRGAINGGGPKVALHTSGGSIRIIED
ncbi:hypothetical protein KUL42_30050 [Alteromonas sp. KUL42]|uniref:DUF4097 family beta strand repeat-containing protein n=1 Tax=Alteromonas sp. KUL42 TaxID=2480797 RepID=UPI001035725D|nr:DUF4097 family beta strand repeat-containing protein [Alteromonas sp. KUL42]TAP33737.1 hypothetical protein EYR97_14100 [Alteromonas sp. KUL42]GEA08244.1 hypothetical protein KUL42_30050 [Alteromonas sp. KUL42]